MTVECIIGDFRILRPRHLGAHAEAVKWLAHAHAHAEAARLLTDGRPHSIPYPVSRPDGRPAPMPKGGRGGKSGLHGQTVPDNVRRDEPFWAGPGTVPQRTDRLGALRLAAARVKRCGKSAPRFRRRKRHGKPHREQDRIGTAREQSRICPDQPFGYVA